MRLPETVTVDTPLIIAGGLLLTLIGAVLAWLGDHSKVTRANEILAKTKGLGRAWLTPAPPTGRTAALKGLPSWVHMATRYGRRGEEVPVVVREVVTEATGTHPVVPDAVGLESGRAVMPVSKARLWGDPPPSTVAVRLGWRARAGIAVGRTLRAVLAAVVMSAALVTPRRRNSSGRHRKGGTR